MPGLWMFREEDDYNSSIEDDCIYAQYRQWADNYASVIRISNLK